MRSLAERLRAYEQQKARLAEAEAKLKIAEKRARARRLAEIGGLAEKAGLSDLEADTLYGGFLFLSEAMRDIKLLDQWATAGRNTLAQEERKAGADHEAIILAFPAPLPKDAISAVRAHGFRFNKILQHWEGLASFKEAQQLASTHGGDARRIGSMVMASTEESDDD